MSSEKMIGANLPLVVRPDAVRRDPPVLRPVTMADMYDSQCRLDAPLWLEVTDGERTIRVQASSAWRIDDRVVLRAEVEQ